MWGRRWAREAGGRGRGRNQAGPWRHGEMANVWQAASSGGSGERSKNFLIHQRTHLGLGQAPQRFSLCTCVCVCVLVLVCERHKCKNNYENFAGNAPPHNNNNNKNSEGRPAKSQNQMWKMFQEWGWGTGRRQEKELSSGAASRRRCCCCSYVFFYRLLPSFLLSCFHCHVKSGKKAKQTRGRQRKEAGERGRQQQGETLKFT